MHASGPGPDRPAPAGVPAAEAAPAEAGALAASPASMQATADAGHAEAAVRDAQPRIDLVGALLLRDGRVLLGLRALHKAWAPGRWDMLGGHVEAGETPWQALRRELREEAGIEIEPGPAGNGPSAAGGPAAAEPAEPRPLDEFDLGGQRLRVYGVEKWRGEVRACGDEHQRLGWFAPAEAAALEELADPRLAALLMRLG